MRLGFLNLQSGVGLAGGGLEWVTGGWRYALPHAPRFLEPLGELARRENLDVLGCAETELPSWRGRGLDYTRAIAEATGLSHGVPFSSFRLGKWVHQGNSLHARERVRATATHELPGPGQRRVVGEVRVLAEDGEWTVLVTHLALGRKARTAQLLALGALLRQRRERTVLMGDFNTASEGELLPLTDAGFTCAATGPTHPTWRPSTQLDRLYASPDLEWHGARVHEDFRVSDHLLVVAEARRAAAKRGGVAAEVA